MKSQLYSPDRVDCDDQTDEYDEYDGFGLNVSKRSSIRRKERFRPREFVPEFNSRSRRKHSRQSIRTDNRFWEV